MKFVFALVFSLPTFAAGTDDVSFSSDEVHRLLCQAKTATKLHQGVDTMVSQLIEVMGSEDISIGRLKRGIELTYKKCLEVDVQFRAHIAACQLAGKMVKNPTGFKVAVKRGLGFFETNRDYAVQARSVETGAYLMVQHIQSQLEEPMRGDDLVAWTNAFNSFRLKGLDVISAENEADKLVVQKAQWILSKEMKDVFVKSIESVRDIRAKCEKREPLGPPKTRVNDGDGSGST